MTCSKKMVLTSPTMVAEIEGHRCSFTARRIYSSILTAVVLPLFISMVSVWISFAAPIGAGMPRIAVTALAYVGMGATFNYLSRSLPSGGGVVWLEYAVFLQLLLCIQGTAAHLIIFAYNDKKLPRLVEILNTTMLYQIPIGYVVSFVVATILVVQLVCGMLLAALMAMAPTIPILYDQYTQSEKGKTLADGAVGDTTTEVRMETLAVGGNGLLEGPEYDALFRRYDIDNSGTINSPEELTQLTLAVIFKYDGDSSGGASIKEVDAKVSEAFSDAKGNGVRWDQEQTRDWLLREFFAGR